jgi:transposase-like protein
MHEPKTLQEAIVYFADIERAFAYAVKLRWPDCVIVCPRCGAAKNSFIKTRRLWFCYGCKRQFTIKIKTIFEDSPLGLDKWMVAFWVLANSKNGVSSHELAKTLGITQTSAWFMLQRIREVMGGRGFKSKSKLGGGGSEVEVDETFVGGKVKNMHRSRRERFAIQDGYSGASTGKTIVQGILDRNLRQVRATVVPNVKRETLQAEILKQVKYGTKVYTDDAVAYEQGLQSRFVHDFVNKTETYVRGRVHVNGMENFWSLLKRTLRGTYVAVEPFHLNKYVDEQVFRFNNRKGLNDAQRFALAMSQVVGKRLTYSELTGKDTDSLHTSPTGTGEAQVPF